MNHIFHFEQLGQQSMEPRQGLVHTPASANRDPSSLPTMTQLTRIFSAAICSLVMALFFFILTQSWDINVVIQTNPFFILAGQVILVGAALVLGAILFTGIPLAVVAWQSTPRSRFHLAIPFLAIVLPMLALMRMGSLFILLGSIPLAVLAWRSTLRYRFLLAIPLLAIVLPVFIFIFHAAWLESLVILFADLLLTIAVWRLTPPPRIHIFLLIPFLAVALLLLTFLLGPLLNSFGISFFLFDFISNVFSYDIPIIGNLGNLLSIVLICGMPIISTIAINRGMQEATIPDKWLRFTRIPSRLVVFALILMFLGLFFWGFYLALSAPALFFTLLSPLNAPWNSWLLLFIGMLISVIVAARALSSD